MPIVHIGDRVWIPVEVQDGAFHGEHLVTFDSKDGPISGFVRDHLLIRDQADSFLSAEVTDQSEDTLTVRVMGSFFTTTGIAYLSPSAGFRKAHAESV